MVTQNLNTMKKESLKVLATIASALIVIVEIFGKVNAPKI